MLLVTICDSPLEDVFLNGVFTVPLAPALLIAFVLICQSPINPIFLNPFPFGPLSVPTTLHPKSHWERSRQSPQQQTSK